MFNKKFSPLYLLLLFPCAVSDSFTSHHLSHDPLSLQKAAGFLLMADFLSYNNSLDSYPSVRSGNEDCCSTQTNCSEDCVTQLRFCFKDYQTVNNISDDEFSGTGCINGANKRATLSKPVEYIDFSDPPLDMKHNREIPIFLRSRHWPVSLAKQVYTFWYIEYFHYNQCREGFSCLSELQ